MTSQQRRHDLRMLLLAVGAITLILLALSLPEPVHSTHIPDGAVSRAVAAPSLQPVPRVEELAAPAPTLEPVIEIPDATIGGLATWYCGGGSPCTTGYDPSDLIAAIDPSLGIAKGERITVHAHGRVVSVLVVDVCACMGRRIVDLSRLAFSRLAPPSVGVLAVSIEFGGAVPTPPATDVGP